MIKRYYGHEELIKEIVNARNFYGDVFKLIKRPENRFITCHKCGNTKVQVEQPNYGNGTDTYVEWIVHAWIGICTRNSQGFVPNSGTTCALYYWFELMDQEQVDHENRRLLSALCDRELKLL